MIIRETEERDLDDIVAIHERAFGQADEAQLTARLLQDPSAVPRLSLLALADGRPAGHILFTRAAVTGAEVSASLLAPLAVVPDRQGRGLGGELIRTGLRRLAGSGTCLVFVLGNPGYYTRFGFRPAGAQGLAAPYPIAPEHADAWMVQDLSEKTLGTMAGRVLCADAIDKQEYWSE